MGKKDKKRKRDEIGLAPATGQTELANPEDVSLPKSFRYLFSFGGQPQTSNLDNNDTAEIPTEEDGNQDNNRNDGIRLFSAPTRSTAETQQFKLFDADMQVKASEEAKERSKKVEHKKKSRTEKSKASSADKESAPQLEDQPLNPLWHTPILRNFGVTPSSVSKSMSHSARTKYFSFDDPTILELANSFVRDADKDEASLYREWNEKTRAEFREEFRRRRKDRLRGTRIGRISTAPNHR